MYPQLIFIAVLGASLLGNAADSISFSYDDQEAWADLPGSFCGGTRQSPINIVTTDVIMKPKLVDLEFDEGWTTSRSGTTKNTGHGAQFTPTTLDAITTTPEGDYRLLQFHFHWGRNASEGSEHTVNGNTYSGELHFVHELVRADENETGEVLGLAVVGVFLEADSGLSIEGSSWENFIVPESFTAGPIDVTGIVYSDFLPEDRGYYYYEGSLTTPLCNEVVEWLVLKQSIKVPSEFLSMLRELEADPADGGGLVEFNFRDTQPLNGRVVMSGEPRAVSAISFFLLLLVSAFAAMV